ncbi:MAG TPA: DNA primase [Bacillota bacterium]|nr:DNA primase [Bacillota bacterium]
MTTSNDSVVEEIKTRCNIVDVIGAVVPLKRAGANYKGLCPFHNEKTPSFVVSDQKQIFTCFGCGVKGDVIEFVKKYYGLEFLDAVEKLAKDYGIPLPERKGFGSQDREELYEINRLAARFYYEQFTAEKNPGYEYMMNRGIHPSILKKFGIGYAKDEWDSLLKHLTGMGISIEKLVEVGLITQANGKTYDKFRNRVMFPIINTGGKVIGFGGRILGEGEPKYLNSPESPIFHKKNHIYGLHLTRSDVGRMGYVILVEGYMDVISLYQHGIFNVGASLGTALTENQARLLKRYADQVVLAYDADNAGVLAAIRGTEILYREGLKAKVLHVTSGKDPDDFVKNKGKEAFLELVKTAKPYGEYMIEVLRKDHDLTTLEGRVEFLKAATDFLGKLTPVEAAAYMEKLARVTGISQGAIQRELRQQVEKQKNKASPSSVSYRATEEVQIMSTQGMSLLEKNLLKLLLSREDYLEEIVPYQEAFESPISRELFRKIHEHISLESALDITKLMDGLDRELLDALTELMESVRLAGKEAQILKECIQTYEWEKLNRREKEILDMLDLADETMEGNDTHGGQLVILQQELMEIQKKKSGGGKKI